MMWLRGISSPTASQFASGIEGSCLDTAPQLALSGSPHPNPLPGVPRRGSKFFTIHTAKPAARNIPLKVSSIILWACVVIGIVNPAAAAVDLGKLTALFRTGQYAECVDATALAIRESEFNENLRVLKLRAELELGRYVDATETLDATLKKELVHHEVYETRTEARASLFEYIEVFDNRQRRRSSTDFEAADE